MEDFSRAAGGLLLAGSFGGGLHGFGGSGGFGSGFRGGRHGTGSFRGSFRCAHSFGGLGSGFGSFCGGLHGFGHGFAGGSGRRSGGEVKVAAEGEVGREGAGENEEDGEDHALRQYDASEILLKDRGDEVIDDAGVRDVDDFT